MGEVQTCIIFSGIEHILIIIAGMVAIYLGYRLFLALPRRREGESKIELPGGVSIFVSRIGPGIFFGLFGAGMIAYSISSVTTVTTTQKSENNTAGKSGAVIASQSTQSITGFGQGGSNANNLTGAQMINLSNIVLIDRKVVMGGLNDLTVDIKSLDDATKRLDRLVALREAKLSIMRESWKSEWGDYERFHRWVTEEVEAEPVPAEIVDAVAFYRTGGK